MPKDMPFADDMANEIAEIVVKYCDRGESPPTILSALVRNLIAASRASDLADADLVSAVRESCELTSRRAQSTEN